MKLLVLLSGILYYARCVQSAAVFAHFMIGNVPHWTKADWEADIALAQEAHIDAFVLNMAESDPNLRTSIATAFSAATTRGFKLLFSFDYAGGKPEGASWKDKATVIALINEYNVTAPYFQYKGKALVSTFEGPKKASDWTDIKAKTGCFFIPSYSSLGAKAAMETKVVDGLFSWAGWPWGDMNMNTYVDESYKQYLGGKEYMMPVSPWFYTNMPGFNKNWLWRGDDLWFDRWRDVMVMKPEFVQIITWNDWGESHYIGPLRDNTYGAFKEGAAPYNYALNMPHDGWRLFLPFLIDTYKTGKGTVTNEGIVTWYRKHPKADCNDGGTTANTASQLQIEFSPAAVVQDRIFYSALLGKGGTTRWVRVEVGGVALVGEFSHIPDGGIGLYHGSVAIGNNRGAVKLTLRRDGLDVVSVTGTSINSTCEQGLQNYNAWVGASVGNPITPIQPALALSQQVCIQGTGAGNFADLCKFTCSYGYCPPACHCTKLGRQKPLPPTTTLLGYPAKGLDENYTGLCNVACNLDKAQCETKYCTLTKSPPIAPTGPSPFLPPACTEGAGVNTENDELCKWTCKFAYCPIHICRCITPGPLELHQSSDETKVCKPSKANTDNRDYKNICTFSGHRHVCPAGPCAPDPVCKDTPTWKDGTETRVGEYADHVLDEGYVSTRTYFTLVNLTPYLFRFRTDLSPKPYQIAINFGDVAPGSARQNVCQYRASGNNPVDDNADMYYEVVGPGHIFHIKCTTHIPDTYPRRVIVDLANWGRGWKEYSEPNAEVPVTWVITGSESYGYYHSMDWAASGALNWMNAHREALGKRALRHVVMPGSHDAGMSRMGKMVLFGTEATTRTQGISIYDQLRAGSRYLDFRVVTWFGEFHTAHINGIKDTVIVGASGETLDEAIDNINRFTTDYPGEVIVIWLKELGEVTTAVGARQWFAPKITEFWDKMKKIRNRCGGLTAIQDIALETLMAKNGGNGCVIIVNGGEINRANGPYTIPDEGIYEQSLYFDRHDAWSDTGEVETLVTDQTSYYSNLRTNKDMFYISQWQLTPAATVSVLHGLEAYAVWVASSTVYWAGVNAMSPTGFPTVIMQDYIGVNIVGRHSWEELGSELKTLALGLNLYLVSENCAIDKRPHPLLEPSFARRLPSPRNNAIFANGTIIEDIPSNFNPNCTEVYKAGTEFMDGTVLKADALNPFCT